MQPAKSHSSLPWSSPASTCCSCSQRGQAFLELRPEATKAFLRRAQGWLAGHARQLIAYTALILGACLTVSALVRLDRPGTAQLHRLTQARVFCAH